MKIEVYSEAQDKADFLIRFGEVPGTLYPERPLPPAGYWPHLISQFPDLQTEFFIATKDGKDIGRIGCNISKGNGRTGFFGFYEVDLNKPEASKALIESALAWLKSHAIDTIKGPVDLNVWLGNRFKIKGSDNFSWEPNAPVEYVEHFKSLGFKKAQGYISNLYDDSILSFERTKSAYDKAISEGLTFRNLDLTREREIETLYGLNIKAFKINYLYEPITKEQYENLHVAAVRSMDMSYSFFVSDPSGKEIGYVFAFPDKDSIIIKSILMDPSAQGARLASALVHQSLKAARENGIIKTVGAMVRKGNVSEHFFDHLQTPIAKHEYEILEMDI